MLTPIREVVRVALQPTSKAMPKENPLSAYHIQRTQQQIGLIQVIYHIGHNKQSLYSITKIDETTIIMY